MPVPTPVVPKTNEVVLLAAGFQEESPVSMLELDFSKPVRLSIINHHGKLLRIRLEPTIAEIPAAVKQDISRKFRKFTFTKGNTYAEMSFYGQGKMLNPLIGTSPTQLPRIGIPFQNKDEDFPLKVGETIAEGLTYHQDRPRTAKGFADAHVLKLDPTSPNVRAFPVLAYEGICQKETLSSMTKRYQAVAGINGAYFTNRGDPIGTLIINKKLISSPLYNRSVFGLTESSQPVFGNPDFSGRLVCKSVSLDIDAVNQPRAEDSLVIFTPEYARSTLTSNHGLELVLVKNRVVGIQPSDAVIPPDGVVVSAGGRKAGQLSRVKLGDIVRLDYQIHQPWNAITHAVCGGPRLTENGKVKITGTTEKFSSSIVRGRHPRTAVAITHEGNLLFVVVDGRSKRSSGMTLSELAEYLIRLGVKEAINMDGGGSSSMFLKNRIVNKPSDGRERPISNGIIFVTK